MSESTCFKNCILPALGVRVFALQCFGGQQRGILRISVRVQHVVQRLIASCKLVCGPPDVMLLVVPPTL